MFYPIKIWVKDNWLNILAIIMLLVALGNHPYSYYQFLRWVVSIAAVCMVYLAHRLKAMFWAWFFVGVAMLFNPISPFYLSRGSWQKIDFVTAVIFFIAIFAVSRKKG